MNFSRRIGLLLGLTVGASACTHYADVHSSESGVNYVSFLVERKDDGPRDGMKQATAYCKEAKKKQAVKVDESFNFVGNTDEETYSEEKAESEVKQPSGIVGKVIEKKNQRKAGSAVMLEDADPKSSATKGYEYLLHFRCE